MRILLLYGTTEGQTRHICDGIASQLTGYGDTVAMHDAASLPAGFSCGAFDAIIIAASVHVGAYQTSVTHFVRTHVEVLNRKPTAFLSVSLAAASSDPEEQKAVADCVRRFLEATVPRSIAAASLVLADSEQTRADVIQLLGVPPEKVVTVLSAPDDTFQPQIGRAHV